MTDTSVVKGFVKSDIKVEGKTVVITGANAGIGFETTLDLVGRGAKVVMVCRDLKKAEEAKQNILEKVKSADIVIQQMDLASLDSVKECAKRIIETESKIDVLINNAGVMMCPPWKTKEGFEMQMGVNHIGHFLFTNLLLDLLKKSAPSRIVIISSIMYQRGKINWDDVMSENSYDAMKAYAASKLANVFHCTELSQKLKGTGVTCNALHPGIIKTDLWRHMGDISHMPFFTRMKMKVAIPFVYWNAITPVQGAQTTIYCAVAPELEKVSGKYFANCAEEELQSHAKNKSDAERLWKMSEEWCKSKF